MTGNLNNTNFRLIAPTTEEFVAISEKVEKIFTDERCRRILSLLKEPEDNFRNPLLIWCISVAKSICVEQEVARMMPPSEQKKYLLRILSRKCSSFEWRELDDHMKMKFRLTLSTINKISPGCDLVSFSNKFSQIDEFLRESTIGFINDRWSHALAEFLRIDMDYYENGPELSQDELIALAKIVHHLLAPMRGRRPKTAVREAVYELKKIWLSCRNDKISRNTALNLKTGDFIDFIKEVLAPFLPEGSPLQSEFSSIAMEVMCRRIKNRNTFDDFLDRIPELNFHNPSS